ncbi:MAG TPA: GH3 auxin-responsive promoter family protein, partial [Thomasclavelia ramosa]|nr:GH3 auxin-responsive promoter family protein [Thomasclavelia ramosa]
ENADNAIAKACQATNSEMIDYTVAPIFMNGKEKGAHEWIIEFKNKPDNIENFRKALDENLQALYSFARLQHNSLFLAGIVLETIPRYTLRKETFVDVAIIKIPVSLEQYKLANEIIGELYGNEEYLYNLFSVLTYPVTKGFATYQSYTCVEFVIHVLSQIGFKFSAPGYYYKPDDLLTIFKDNIYFEGNLLDYCPDERIDEQYFAPMSFEVAKKSAKCFGKIVGRSIFCRGDDYFKNKEMFWDKNNFH